MPIIVAAGRIAPVGIAAADLLGPRRAVAEVEVAARAEVCWVRAQADQRSRGVPHLHALLYGAGFEPMRFIKYWERRHGWARVAPVYDRAGAPRHDLLPEWELGDETGTNHPETQPPMPD